MFHHQASHKSFHALSSFWLTERERAPGSSRRQVLKWKSSFQAGSRQEWQRKESPDHLKQISVILSNYIWVHSLPYEVYLNIIHILKVKKDTSFPILIPINIFKTEINFQYSFCLCTTYIYTKKTPSTN